MSCQQLTPITKLVHHPPTDHNTLKASVLTSRPPFSRLCTSKKMPTNLRTTQVHLVKLQARRPPLEHVQRILLMINKLYTSVPYGVCRSDVRYFCGHGMKTVGKRCTASARRTGNKCPARVKYDGRTLHILSKSNTRSKCDTRAPAARPPHVFSTTSTQHAHPQSHLCWRGHFTPSLQLFFHLCDLHGSHGP